MSKVLIGYAGRLDTRRGHKEARLHEIQREIARAKIRGRVTHEMQARLAEAVADLHATDDDNYGPSAA